MGLTVSASDLMDGLVELAMTVPQKVQAGAAAVAAEMEGYAKLNAPWTDRTGNARRTMTGFAQWSDSGDLVVGVAGHMDYSPKLELRHGRRYAILVPTVDAYAPTILDAVAQAALAQGGISIE